MNVTSHRRPARLPLALVAAVALGALALSACGSGSGDRSDSGSAAASPAPSSTAKATVVTTAASTAPSSTTPPSSAPASSATPSASVRAGLPATICDVIRAAQSDVIPGVAGPAAYQAQFVLKAIGPLSPGDLQQVKAGRLDAPVDEACPTEYREFLRQSEITSLGAL